MSKYNVSRRTFIQAGGWGLAGSAIALRATADEPFQPVPEKMPRRLLGKTGVEVSVLGLGGVGATTDFPSDLLTKLKQQKVIRFIGVTGHVAGCLKEAVTRYDFDTILMTLC